MDSNKCIETYIVLFPSAEEALWLKNLFQNPLQGETEADTKIRKSFYKALTDQGVQGKTK